MTLSPHTHERLTRWLFSDFLLISRPPHITKIAWARLSTVLPSNIFTHPPYLLTKYMSEFLGKNNWMFLGIALIFTDQLLSHVQIFVTPWDCSPPGSSVHGISQARTLDWVSISSSRGSTWPRDQIPSSALQADSLPWASWEVWDCPN